MEILNKNQRQSAIWRLLGLGLAVLAVNAAILFAVHEAYANVGSGPLDDLKRKLQACQTGNSGASTGAANKIKELDGKVKALEAEKAQNASKYEMMKTRVDFLEKDLLRCQMAANRPPTN